MQSHIVGQIISCNKIQSGSFCRTLVTVTQAMGGMYSACGSDSHMMGQYLSTRGSP
jgi:hypothetical protein